MILSESQEFVALPCHATSGKEFMDNVANNVPSLGKDVNKHKLVTLLN